MGWLVDNYCKTEHRYRLHSHHPHETVGEQRNEM